MPKMTRAQREAAAEQYQAEQRVREAAEYPSLLMKTLGLATTVLNFELVVMGDQFKLRDRTEPRSSDFRLELNYTQESYETLQDLAFTVQFQVDEQNNRREVEAFKAAALSKLTLEERTALGL